MLVFSILSFGFTGLANAQQAVPPLSLQTELPVYGEGDRIVIIGLVYSLLISPPDYIQGDSVRIMYVHVPSSLIALGCFGFMGAASILNLIFKINNIV